MKIVTLIAVVTLLMMAMLMVIEIVMLMAILLMIVTMMTTTAVMSTEMMAKSDDGGGGPHPRTTFPALPPGKMRGHTFRQDDHHQPAGHDHHLVALEYERHFHQADRGDCLNALNSPHFGLLGL